MMPKILEYCKKFAPYTILFIVGACVGRWSLPAKVVTTEHIVYQDRIVEKKVEVKAVQKKDNKVFIQIVKTSPDGSKTIETQIVDKDITETTDITKDNKAETVSSTKDTSTTTTYATDNYLLSVLIDDNLSNFSLSPNYGAMLQRRIIGPFYLGAFANTAKTVGVGVGLSF